MNHPLERLSLIVGLTVLCASFAFGLGLAGPAFALPGALLLGAGTTALWIKLKAPADRTWLPPLVLGIGVLISSAALEALFRPDFAGWFAFLFAAAGSAVVMFVHLRSRVRCHLCQRRLSSQAVTFRCPRCGLQVCDETCWDFEHRRCRLCLEQRVPILPIQDAWWTRNTGPRSNQGRCQLCLASAEQTDLRHCPRCRRLQCRDCWDFSNGECSRCATSLPELPAALGAVVAGLERGHS